MTVSPSKLRIWLEASRPRTLPAAVAPVVVGTALAWRCGSADWLAGAICLAFALLIQIGTNFANDYFDFVKGADTAARVGPRRAVAAGLVSPATMRWAMCGTFALAFAVGLSLLAWGGWWLIAVGVASVVCGIAYTGGPYPLGYHGWGDLFVFIFFGLVAVGATFFVQAGCPTREVWVVAMAIGVLAANILVANNYRDVETDRLAGKRTLVVRFGRGFAQGQFLVAHAVALLVPVWLAFSGWGDWGWLAPLEVAGGWVAWRQFRMLRRAESPQALIRLLGFTGMYLAAYALGLSGWLVWGQ